MRKRTVIVAFALTAAAVLAGSAHASQLIGRDAQNVKMQVNGAGAGQALVTFHAQGRMWHVKLSGALNARPPVQGAPQVKFEVDYSGRGFSGGGCKPYTGQYIPWMVAACDAPDGSHWAAQSWQRLKANYGGAHAPWELHVSHWTGSIAKLTIETDWAYGRFDHLYGSFTYQGQGIYGFKSSSAGNPLDAYGRNLYVDTANSAYGYGWRRENSFLTHRPNGSFCYGFYPHGSHPAGKGSVYRATVIGPGVTPDVTWQAKSPGPFDAELEQAANDQQRQLFADSPGCKVR
jgi:hypothetical protein